MKLLIENLSKTYPNGVRAIDDLSLEMTTGMFGLLGPNGAGKSTLMRIIATLQDPDSGKLSFNGIDIVKDKTSLRRILGYLPQDFGVYPKVSALKLLDYFATLKGISSAKDRSIAVEEVLHMTNLFEVRKKSVSGYSGGMKQRFGIAQLLLNKPQLIVVDEPTAGLDPNERSRFLNVLRDIGTDHVVLFSTHLVQDVRELCTDMAIVDRGKVLKRSSPREATMELDGKVWIKEIHKRDLESYKTSHSLLSSSFNQDNSLTVRVYSTTAPRHDFRMVAPNLEDVYFSTLRDQQ